MRIFIGQGVTGENIEKIREELVRVYSALEEAGHTYYDTLRDGTKELSKKPKKERLKYAFREIDYSDTFLAIVRSERKSEGMLMEFGYALSQGKKMILAVKRGVNTSLKDLVNNIIEYEDTNELNKKLKELK